MPEHHSPGLTVERKHVVKQHAPDSTVERHCDTDRAKVLTRGQRSADFVVELWLSDRTTLSVAPP
ncbi:hypothetical protein ABZX73_09725 [Brevibacterium casei]